MAAGKSQLHHHQLLDDDCLIVSHEDATAPCAPFYCYQLLDCIWKISRLHLESFWTASGKLLDCFWKAWTPTTATTIPMQQLTKTALHLAAVALCKKNSSVFLLAKQKQRTVTPAQMHDANANAAAWWNSATAFDNCTAVNGIGHGIEHWCSN